jgi:hypothetical protein
MNCSKTGGSFRKKEEMLIKLRDPEWERQCGQHYAIITAAMEFTSPRKNVTSRVIRKDDPLPEEPEQENSTPEERINAVWELTLLCLAWQRDLLSEPRLQRSVSRIQRPGR